MKVQPWGVGAQAVRRVGTPGLQHQVIGLEHTGARFLDVVADHLRVLLRDGAKCLGITTNEAKKGEKKNT